MAVAFEGFGDIIVNVILAVAPLAIAAFVSQVTLLKMSREEMQKIVVGLIFSMIGLALFLQGVQIGFMPAGELIGASLGAKSYAWVLVPLGVWLGVVSALAEPAVLVLADEVEKVSAGSISKRFLLPTLAAGVGLLVGLAMLRVLLDIPFIAILLPGYALAFLMIPFVSSALTSIAFDAGVVATGPMTVTFVLAISLGAAAALGRDPVTTGFGLVAFVALAPTLSVLAVGVVLRIIERRKEKDIESQATGETEDSTG